MKRLLSLVFLLCLLTASLSFAQDPGTGTPAFDAFSHAGGGIDTINLGNLNVHMEIPLRSLGAYGPKASTALELDSLETYDATNDLIVPPKLFALQSSTSKSVARVAHLGTDCTNDVATANGVLDGRSTFHSTPVLTLNGCNAAAATAPGSDGWAVMGKTGPSGLATWYTISPNGDVTQSSGSTTTDPHGNTVSGAPSFGVSGSAMISYGILNDALGQTVLQGITSTPSATVQFTHPGPNSTTSTYTLSFITKTVYSNFGCGAAGEQLLSQHLLSGITFPDTSTMSFTYESVYNDSSKTTGRIASVKLRTGATITYNYTGYGTNGVNCSDGSTAGFTKTTPDGVWTFTHTAPAGTNNGSWSKVVAPSGDYTLYEFAGLYPTREISYNAAGQPFKSAIICYNGNTTTCDSPPSAPTMPITERDVYSYITGVTNPALKVFLYDTYSRLTDVKTYDFGGVRGGANFATEEQLFYGTFVSGHFCQNQTENVQGISVQITGLVCADAVTTPGVSGQVSYRLNTYAANTTDLTTRNDLIGGVWRATTNVFDSLGRLKSSTGPNGESNTITYANCGGQEPDTFTSKVSGSLNLVQTLDGFDCFGELPLHGLDANNNPTTISYTGDPFWRPTSVTDATGTVTTFNYTSPTSTTISTPIASGSVKESVETLDSMGRKHVEQQRQSLTSTQYNSVETDYDINGRVSRVTTPYQAALGGTNGTIVSTLYAYDAINRPTTVTSPNGTVQSFTYTASGSARDTLVGLNAGPNGEIKQTQYEYNGLGRVTSVCEITSMTGSYGCGQANPVNGFKTSYTYSGPGNLLNIKQNDGGSTSQNRSFTYENSNTGRVLTQTTPESGTVSVAYDSDSTCGTFVGAVVKKSDNGGGTTCLSYDLLGRVTSKTYSGLNSGNTPNVKFIYDSTTNASINCPTGNQLGRLAEVSTGGGAPNGYTDEGFCYDVVGNPTDVFSWINGTIWVHAAESYFPTGIPKTLSVGNQPTITYGLDPMARINTANASSGQNPLTSVNYNTAGLPTAVNFGSGDSSAYGWLNGIGPMTSAAFNVGSSESDHTLTWNANGTLQKLAITDTLNSADAQTCNYTYDDLQRILTDNCGSVWNQSFGYDPFGNVTKSGSISWQPGYNQTNNHYQLSGTAYDANGRLTQDTFDTGITWDIDGNIVTQSGTWFAYDGLGRNMGSVLGSTYVNNIYAPDGTFFATADNNGNIKKMFVPLPMSTAVYSGGSLQQYRRTDWQGSVRVASTPSKALFSDTAYGAFGEPYSPKGTTNNQYAGLTSDISSGTEQVSGSRRYHPTQGRWISPDGGIPNILNPQTFNAYHYALNSPTNSTDPSGALDALPAYDNLGDGTIGVDVLIGGDFGFSDTSSGMAEGLNIAFQSMDNALGALISSDVSGQIGDGGPAGGASSSWDNSGGTCQANGWVDVGGGIQMSNEDYSRTFYPTPQEQAVRRQEMVNEALSWAMIGAVGSPFGAQGGIGGVTSEPFRNVVGTTAKFAVSEAPSFYTEGSAFRQYMTSKPGMVGIGKSWETAGVSFYQEAMDGSGMWRTSNHWGQLGTSNWSFGTPGAMRALGGVEVESGFWLFNRPVSGFVKYTDMTPLP